LHSIIQTQIKYPPDEQAFKKNVTEPLKNTDELFEISLSLIDHNIYGYEARN